MKPSREPVVKYRKDYLPSQYLIKTTNLNFQLFEDFVVVESKLTIEANPLSSNDSLAPLVLDGIELELLELKVNQRILSPSEYQVGSEHLIIKTVSDSFIVETKVKIYPAKNTSLEGLYLSNGKFCTQCEAEGFRKITYYIDRPEIMSEFSVSLEADQSKYPMLLSNGNHIATKDLGNGRHVANWHDPFLKPSYLFALVAGDFDCLDDQFITMSGRNVELKLFVEKGKLDQCRFAMDSLIHSMKWDEQEFGREYDLDLYMIVAVSDFNMGAMENKGLNVFNTAYVLANHKTATDADFEGVERVIAHEYFHNWTGNRVTCRDWFQLSLKEGLTVFRDQKFSEDMQSAAVERIDQVKIIRAAQFAEDSGPMAHSIRPDSYIEMNNFYTVTVYNKGAEVIRMMHTLVGKQGFRAGMDLYFERFDGQAVTCEDFIRAMEDANKVDWRQFRNWYRQAGTPVLEVSQCKNQSNQSNQSNQLTLNFSQTCHATPGQPTKKPFMIPVKIGFLDQHGNAANFCLANDSEFQTEALIIIEKDNQSFDFKFDDHIDVEKIIPSILRDFTAPVKLKYDYSQEQLITLFSHDLNSFNRWDAGQSLISNLLLSENEMSNKDLNSVSQAILKVLNDTQLDSSLKALAVQMPNLNALIGEKDSIDLDQLFNNYRTLRQHIATSLETTWLNIYNASLDLTQNDQISSGERWLKNCALSYLVDSNPDSYVPLAKLQQNDANNMTDEITALQVVAKSMHQDKQACINSFFEKWNQEELVLDKWFSAQMQLDDQQVIHIASELMQHEKFSITNPNKVRSLVGALVGSNTMQFHNSTGAGYEFLANMVIKLNKVNPQIGSRLAKQFGPWKKLDNKRKAIIKELLEQILAIENLSNDIYEVVNKSLQD